MIAENAAINTILLIILPLFNFFIFLFLSKKKTLQKSRAKKQFIGFFFSHPDYTVGTGISPVHAITLADFTAGKESHLALKKYSVNKYKIIITQEVLFFN